MALENLISVIFLTKNYTNALSFYRMMRFLAGENEPDAKSVYEDMKVLFKRNDATVKETEVEG